MNTTLSNSMAYTVLRKRLVIRLLIVLSGSLLEIIIP